MNIGSLVKGKWECRKKSIKNIEMICLPRKHVKTVTGKITCVSQLAINCWTSLIIHRNYLQYDSNLNRFWFRPDEEDKLFTEIQAELNSLNRDIEEFANYGDVKVGQTVAASYNGNYYRAKVLLSISGSTSVYYTVLLHLSIV